MLIIHSATSNYPPDDTDEEEDEDEQLANSLSALVSPVTNQLLSFLSDKTINNFKAI
jgi:hypothetical protein